jgi:hypothetical protein
MWKRLTAFLLLLLCAPVLYGFDGYGEWRGQAQYIVAKHGEAVPPVQEIVPLVIRIDADGKVIGSSTENGCRLSGLVSPMGNNVMALDVTLRDCRSKDLNRRLSGTVAHYPADRRIALSLNYIDGRAKPVTTYEVKSPIMRR